jgi:hypothetical protein
MICEKYAAQGKKERFRTLFDSESDHPSHCISAQLFLCSSLCTNPFVVNRQGFRSPGERTGTITAGKVHKGFAL